ncbi:PREDICTED: TSC22 domain family protein 1 [Miniopterus natalensis]|uniref:TSC22 domain family protein 1 n=1 Tax=Miniopterus natalensis TaxID=291302 RepID=UPI0007A7021E|nr:PREDICTED: TSC22 domain family protein 1 [Miniopterus natalensis]XP_016060917.1 PREDICTED: TSC22 domain family protein 1 [Miniopterus natalensis]
MHQPPESAAAAAAADISARKMAHPAIFPRRGSGSGSASALNAAGTGAGSNATSSEDFPPPSLLQPPPPAASCASGPQPPPPQSLNLLSQAQLQTQPLAPGGTQMKKKSGFQITSVTPAQISASISSNNSIAEDTESYDDLDESHTEDLSSSEILDVSLSRATDLGEPERSSSEETLNNFQEAETPGAVSPNQPHLPQPHLPHLPQQNVVINGNAHPHHLHHHHHVHHGHHLHHGHHHPSHAGVASTSIPGGPPSSPVSRKLSTTGSSDSVIPAALTSAVSSGSSPASVMTNIRAPTTTGSIGINSVTGTNTVNNVNITAVGSFNPNVTSSMLGNANINTSNIPSAASVSAGPGVNSGVNVNISSGMGNGTISSTVNSVVNAAAGMTVGSVSSQQQQPTVNTSRFRVVKLDASSEPFKKGRWTCTEFYEKENAVPTTEGVVNKVVETVKQNPIEVTSERESTSGSSVSSSVSTLSHYTESVGSGEMGAPTVVVQQQQQQQPTLQGVALQQMDFSSTGPQSIPAVSISQSVSHSQISQVQLQSQELSYQQKQGVQPVPLQATINAATGIQPSPVNVVGVPSALGQQPSISSLAQPQLPYSQTAPPVQAPLPGAPPQQLQYGQQSTVSTQMAPGHGKPVTQIPTSEYVQQQPILQTAVSSGQPSSAGVGGGTTLIPMAQPQSIQLPVQPPAVQAQPAGACGQPVGQAQTAVSAVPTGSQIANIVQQANVPTAVQQPSSQVTPSVVQQGAPPSSQVVPPAQTAIIHQGVQTSASSLPQQLVIAPQSTLLTVPPQPQGLESVAQGVVSQQLPAVSPVPSASSISVTNQVSSAGPSGMPSAPTNLVPPQNIAQTPATQNGSVVQSVSQPPSIATNINLPLAQQISLSSQFSAQSLAQAIGSQIEDARRPAEPSLVGLPQTVSGDSGGMSAVSDGSSSNLAASASLFPLKVLPLTTPLVDGEDESSLFQCFSPTRGARSDPRTTDTAKTTESF